MGQGGWRRQGKGAADAASAPSFSLSLGCIEEGCPCACHLSSFPWAVFWEGNEQDQSMLGSSLFSKSPIQR